MDEIGRGGGIRLLSGAGRGQALVPRTDHLLLWPVGRYEDARDEGEGRAPWARVALGDDLLDEAAILVAVAIVERRLLDEDARRQPANELWRDEPAADVEVDLVWQAMREELVHVLRDVGCRHRVLVGERERQRRRPAFFGRQDECVADGRTRADKEVGEGKLLELGVVHRRPDDLDPALGRLDGLCNRPKARSSPKKGWEGRRELAAGEEAEVEKLILAQVAERREQLRLVHKGQGRVDEVEREDELVGPVDEEQGLVRPVDRVDVALGVLEQVDELRACGRRRDRQSPWSRVQRI